MYAWIANSKRLGTPCWRISEGAPLISKFYERFSIQRPSPDEAFDYDELYDQMMSERFSDWIEL